MSNVMTADLQTAMDKGLMKSLRFILTAMAVAPLAYVPVGLLAVRAQGSHAAPEPSGIFLACLGAVAVLNVALARVLPERRLRRTPFDRYFEQGMPLPGRAPTKDRGEIVSVAVRGYYLFRAALVQAIAIYGLLVTFLSVGVVAEQPLYWLALAVCPVVSVALFLMIPAEEDVRRLFGRTLGQ